MKKSQVLLSIAFAFASAHAFAEGAAHWSYQGKTGPQAWGSLSKEFLTCKTGEMQSPLDIKTAGLEKSEAGPLQINYKSSAADLINNGHTIQVSLADGGAATLGGKSYKVLQFHFHTPSEEKVNGKGYPINAHLVHKSDDGSLGVIGVFFKVGKENQALKGIFAHLPKKEGKTALKSHFDAASLLPATLEYYSYQGSLTTPPCSEGVSFYILKNPIEMSKKQLEAFRKVFKMNARPVQPLNGRKVAELS